MQRSQPAFAFGDVVQVTNSTDVRSITERHSLFLFSVVRIAVGASCDALSLFGGAIRIYPVPLEGRDRLGLFYTPAVLFTHDRGTGSLSAHCKKSPAAC
jgi:hypothetical protein